MIIIEYGIKLIKDNIAGFPGGKQAPILSVNQSHY